MTTVLIYYLFFKYPKENSEDICLRLTKRLLVLPANGSLVGILITIGDVTDIFAICPVTTVIYSHQTPTHKAKWTQMH